jgi:hypothetical protein
MLSSYRIPATVSLGVHAKARRGRANVAIVERLGFDSRPYIANASPASQSLADRDQTTKGVWQKTIAKRREDTV